MNTNKQCDESFSLEVVGKTAIIELKSKAFRVLLDLSLKEAFLNHLEEIRISEEINGLVVFDSTEFHDFNDYVDFAETAVIKHSAGSLCEMDIHRLSNAEKQITVELLEFSKPIVAGIQGRIPIENFGYYLACDYRIAAENMQIEFPDLSLGLAPVGAASYFLRNEVGPNKTLEMYLSGKTLSASEAKNLNIVNEVVPVEELHNSCENKLDNLSHLSRNSLAAAKKLIKPEVSEIENYLEYSWELFWMALLGKV